MTRTKALPAFVVAFTVAALVTIIALQTEAGSGRDAQLTLANLKAGVTALQTAPFQASATTGGSPERARALMKTGKSRVAQAFAALRQDSPVPVLTEIRGFLHANYGALDKIYAIGASGGAYGAQADRLAALAARAEARFSRGLDEASDEYDSRASTADARATAGSVATIAILVLAFLFFYRRATRARSSAERLARDNEILAAASREEARTDALTGLGNRRALLDDLEAALAAPEAGRQLVVALFDLDGFKQYNDTFGHPAGDVLLSRLGGRLRLAVAEVGTAYRMGGDEFCVLAWVGDGGESLAQLAGEALMESGGAFQIGNSYGLALVPEEASSSEGALQLADQRMYTDKVGRSPAGRQSADVLLEVLSERSLDLREHIKQVAINAAATAEMLGLPAHEVSQIGLAAELHDVGKVAIPEAILDKPGALDASELEFIRSHTVVGERIVLAAPSLAPLAGLVRSSHERFDGAGYPDGLGGSAIPRGAAVIAVCDAFDAMVADRPYRKAISTEDALAEIRHHKGTQFDPEVVEAFLAVVAERGPAPTQRHQEIPA